MRWADRIKSFWTKVAIPPPIGDNVEYWYRRNPEYGRFGNGFNVFGPYRRPIIDATGGGTLNGRQLYPCSPQSIFNREFVPVAITGNGAELHGTFTVLPLVDTQQQVVSVQTNAAGQTTITETTQNPGIL